MEVMRYTQDNCLSTKKHIPMKKIYHSPATICVRTACRMSILTGSMKYHDNDVITNSGEIMSRQSNGLWDDDSEDYPW